MNPLVAHYADHYGHYAEDCVKFRGKDGSLFAHSNPHPGQVKLRALDLKQRQVYTILKARQVGCTSEVASLLSHLALFTPGTSIAVMAQTGKGVQGIQRLYATIFANLPSFLRKGIFKAEIKASWIVLANGSRIDFGTANSESFRGVPRQAAHLTECAFFEDLEGTLKGMRPTVYGALILESTANGPGTYHELWNDPALSHVFISWRDDSTCRSTEPLSPPPTNAELDYVDSKGLSDDEARWYISRLRQSNWTAMKQEHPTTPDEAFVLGGSRFFAQGWFPGDTTRIPDLHTHLPPTRGKRYAIGVDCASGSPTGDRSTAVVLDVTDPLNIRTAASYATRMAPTAFGVQVARLSRDYFRALVCVERNAGYGLTVLDTLRQAGIPLYRRKVMDKVAKTYTEEYGWNTTANTRPLLLSALQNAVDQRVYIPDDPRIESEFNSFRYNDANKPEATPGCHDDLVFACALALQAISQATDTTLAVPETPRPSPQEGVRAQLEWSLKTGVVSDPSPVDDD